MTNVNTVTETGSMPISMAVGSNTNQSAPCEVAAAKAEAQAPAKPEQKKDRAYFSRAIETASLTMYRSARAVSDLLFEAHMALSPEEYKAFLEEDCPFDYSQVCKFIKMAADYRLNDPANEPILPEAWTARYEIMQMKDATFRKGVKSGIIKADCKLADLKKLREQVEGKKAKKQSDKSSNNEKGKTTAKTETPKPTAAPVNTAAPVEKAAVKAPVNTAALHAVPSVANAAPATATATAAAPAKGRIAIVVTKSVADQHNADLDRLKEDIEALVKQYDFMGAVELDLPPFLRQPVKT